MSKSRSNTTFHFPANDIVSRISQKEYKEASVGIGWRPRLRERYGYFLPEHYYEAVVEQLVTSGCRWLDVGGGKAIFPLGPRLSQELVDRARHVCGVDPDENILQNPYVHERFVGPIESYQSAEPYDLATLRMVAEHIPDPAAAVASLAKLVRPGGHVVVFTPYRWSPVSIASSLIPSRWHSLFTKRLWNTKDSDVFPTCYRMNTRRALSGVFEDNSFL
jgi:2-polyprenyl-3-methyl-5-hydroxy-6-metoxy-1,4-benzoquinol methylase